MMQNQKDLQSVLDEMFAAEKNFSFEIVREWQKRYPQFSAEIAQSVADWREFEFFALEDREPSEAAELSETARRAMENALTQFQIPQIENFTDLRELAAKRGVARADLPAKLGVSETITRKIERRSLREIPSWLEEKIGEIFRVSAESVRAFFELPATLSPAAKYKSKNAPQTQPKQTFAETVKNDPELTDDEKRELLSRK